MHKLFSVGYIFLFAVGLSFPAQAYVDPGTGTMLIQILIGLSIGVAFYFRKVRDAIKSFLGMGTETVRDGDGVEKAGTEKKR